MTGDVPGARTGSQPERVRRLVPLDGTAATLSCWVRPADPAAEPGPDLLLVHGYGLTSGVWEPLLPFLPRGHRVVAYDARDHGLSSSTATSTLEDNVADAVAVIEGLGLVRPVVVGSSIGAIWATELAHRRPDLLGAAVLVGGLAHAGAVEPAIASGNRDLIEGYRADLLGTARAAVPSWFGPLVGPRVHEWAVDMVRSLRVPDLALADDLEHYDPRPYLPDIATPLHYVHGRLDPIPLAVVEEAAALGPCTSLTVVDGAAHMPHVELPGRFADVLTDVTRSCGDGSSSGLAATTRRSG